MNSQSAIPLLWDLGPDPKATENKDAYMASKGSYDYQEQILQQAFFFPPPYPIWGLDRALSKEMLNGLKFLYWFVAIHKL